ncbi:MASE3 domain-containing protein [Sulfuriflexus mobilis]|uniref:MASE3 domain-containing protein n=1 Tax=Sulfuriflexus mobilis TaxID=1811807 RepID=UPI000F83A052|nr:MASE3 domain-containing protein [Sulfuriflexus mobilis]
MDTDIAKQRNKNFRGDRLFFIAAPFVIAIVLLLSLLQNFLLFHTLAEFFAIIIAMLVGLVAWHTYPFTRNSYLMFLGCGYFWVGVIDLAHALAYKGMSTFDNAGANLSVQFWLGARFLEAGTLLMAPLFLSMPLHRKLVFSGIGMLALGIFLSVWFGHFPSGYIEGTGLTAFKIYSEYLIIAIIALAIVHVWQKRSLLEAKVVYLMIASMLLTILAEIAFTFYVGVYDLSNAMGHILKFVSYWLIFVAVIRYTLSEPFTMLARGASTFDAVPDATIVVDRQGLVRQVNKAAAQMTGKNEQALLGKDCHTLFHSAFAAKAECPICEHIENESPLDYLEVEHQDAQGCFIYTLAPISGADESGGMVQVIRDVSRLRKTEHELRQAQARMADMFKRQHAVTSALTNIMCMINVEGQLIWWNEVLEKVTGLTADKLKHKPIAEFIVEEERRQVITVISDCLKKGHAEVEVGFITTEGIRPYHYNVVVVRNDDGEVEGIAGLGQDISARIQAEQALKTSEERFQLAVRGSSDGIWDWDIKTGEVFYSERFKELLGFTGDDFSGHISSFKQRIHPDDEVYVTAALNAHLERRMPFHAEFRIRLKQGDYRWCLMRGQAIWDESGEARRMAGSLTDITRRKQDEVELDRHRKHLSELVEERTSQLAQARDEALQASHAKSLFLANMSHELRTPLNSIIGFTTILREGMAGSVNEEQSRQLHMVQDNSHQLLNLINDILDLSKVEAGKLEVVKETFAIVSLVEDLMSQMQPLAEAKGLSLDLELAIDNPVDQIYTDYSKLRQVLTNLLSNAIKFTHQGGVTLKLAQLSGRDLVIEVSDTGIGIPDSYIEQIFTAFKQVDERSNRLYEGTGLGLTISKRFTELLGGSLVVSSIVGKGSSFCIKLPDVVVHKVSMKD